jgi:hypothetical protein
VYAYAAACYLGIQSYREASWSRREQKIVPREADLFSAPAVATSETITTTPTRERPYETKKQAGRDW